VHTLFNDGPDSLAETICDDLGMNLTATLKDAKEDSLTLAASTSDFLLPLVDVHVASFATDEGFIDLDFTSYHELTAVTRCNDPRMCAMAWVLLSAQPSGPR
jgi:hypothetical protein